MLTLFKKDETEPQGPRETLLSDVGLSRPSQMKSHSTILSTLYAKLSLRFHTFFLCLITIQGVRLSFYMILRFHNYREIFATLKLADNIEGMHTYMMGVEELFINLVLISYLFAVKDNMVANENGTSEDTDDEL